MFSKFVKTNEKIDYNIIEKIKEKYPGRIPIIVREMHPELELTRKKISSSKRYYVWSIVIYDSFENDESKTIGRIVYPSR